MNQIGNETETPRIVQTDLGKEVRCSKCGEHWPADSEFFYTRKGKLHSWCKACYVNDPNIIEKVKRYNGKLADRKSLPLPAKTAPAARAVWNFMGLQAWLDDQPQGGTT